MRKPQRHPLAYFLPRSRGFWISVLYGSPVSRLLTLSLQVMCQTVDISWLSARRGSEKTPRLAIF